MPLVFARIRSVPVMQALLAIVALVSQLALGSLVLPDPAAAKSAAEFRAATVLCRSAAHHQAPPTHQRRQPTQQAASPLDALELAAVILPPAVMLPLPHLPPGSRMAILPPARAPPASMVRAQRARGPPRLA